MRRSSLLLLVSLLLVDEMNCQNDQVITSSCMSKAEHSNRANLQVPGPKLSKVWPTSDLVSRMPSLGGTEEVEVYVMKTFVSIISEDILPNWIIDVPYYAIGLRPLDDVSWQHAQSATLIHYAPNNTTALLGFANVQESDCVAHLYTSNILGTDEWETASFVARITGEEVQRLAEGMIDYVQSHPYYQAIAATPTAAASFDASTDSSASADFAIWVLNKLTSDGVTVAPLIPPKFIHMTYHINSVYSLASQKQTINFLSFIHDCFGLSTTLQNSSYILIDELAVLLSTCLSNSDKEHSVSAVWPMTLISTESTKHGGAKIYTWSLVVAELTDYAVATAIAPPGKPSSDSNRTKGKAVDWILTILLIIFFFAGIRAFMVKTGCARQFAYAYLGTPLVQTSHEREARECLRSNNHSSELYERLQHTREVQLNHFSPFTSASGSARRGAQNPSTFPPPPSSSSSSYAADSNIQNGRKSTVETTAGFV